MPMNVMDQHVHDHIVIQGNVVKGNVSMVAHMSALPTATLFSGSGAAITIVTEHWWLNFCRPRPAAAEKVQ